VSFVHRGGEESFVLRGGERQVLSSLEVRGRFCLPWR